MKLQLVDIIVEAKNTKSYFFKPKSKVKYLPGQFFYITLPKLIQNDSRGPTRLFTLSSSPTEGDILRITTRIRDNSGFKQTINKLKKGNFVEGDGPNGTFILDEKEKGPHVFLVGGIGITPYRSIIKYYIDSKLETNFTLIYSNRKVSDIAFKDELFFWQKSSKYFELFLTLTKPSKNWKGLTGRIDFNMIKKIVNDPHKVTFWITGPPSFVESMEELLESIKIPSSKVRSEKFTGY